jgi:excisionase family DNA binding protein
MQVWKGGEGVSTTTTEPRALTVAEVASKFGISRSTVYDWESRGLIPKRMPAFPGGLARWHSRDVDAALDRMNKAQSDEERAA